MKRRNGARNLKSPSKRLSIKAPLLAAVVLIIAFASASALMLIPEAPPSRPLYVGIVDQFYSESPEFTDRAVALLGAHNVSYGLHTGSEVDVALYKDLPSFGYNLIILRVHAGVNQGIGESTFLFTAEPFSRYRYVYEVNTSQLAPGLINPDRPEGVLFTVGPQFVKRSIKGDFNGAILILSSCHGLHNNALAEAFIQKGVSQVIGWDGLVSLDRTDAAVLELLTKIVEGGASPRDAFLVVQSSSGRDQYYGSELKIYPPVK